MAVIVSHGKPTLLADPKRENQTLNLTLATDICSTTKIGFPKDPRIIGIPNIMCAPLRGHNIYVLQIIHAALILSIAFVGYIIKMM